MNSPAQDGLLMLRRMTRRWNAEMQTARDLVIALTAEIRDARGSHATVNARLAALEANIAARATPPNT